MQQKEENYSKKAVEHLKYSEFGGFMRMFDNDPDKAISFIIRNEEAKKIVDSDKAFIPHNFGKDFDERYSQLDQITAFIKSFNQKPSKALNKLDNIGINSSEEKGAFIYKYRESLDKTQLGNLLGTGDLGESKEKEELRKGFVSQFKFEGKEFLPSLREYLGGFKLPGEAQKIDKLMESFAHQYYDKNQAKDQNNRQFENADAAYVLAFSTIMLNTDLHNPNMDKRNRMTLDQFINNNRGINNEKDFPKEMLTKLYNDIKAEPLKFPEEQKKENPIQEAKKKRKKFFSKIASVFKKFAGVTQNNEISDNTHTTTNAHKNKQRGF